MAKQIFEIEGLFKIGETATEAKTDYGFKTKKDAEVALSNMNKMIAPRNPEVGKDINPKVETSQLSHPATGTASGAEVV